MWLPARLRDLGDVRLRDLGDRGDRRVMYLRLELERRGMVVLFVRDILFFLGE